MITSMAPLTGRDEDVRRMEHALSRAADGVGAVVLLSGEAGIGKTRLCQELQRTHAGQGGPTLVGRSSPGEAVVALGTVADALRGARRSEPRFWEAARARAAALWPIVPE